MEQIYPNVLRGMCIDILDDIPYKPGWVFRVERNDGELVLVMHVNLPVVLRSGFTDWSARQIHRRSFSSRVMSTCHPSDVRPRFLTFLRGTIGDVELRIRDYYLGNVVDEIQAHRRDTPLASPSDV